MYNSGAVAQNFVLTITTDQKWVYQRFCVLEHVGEERAVGTFSPIYYIFKIINKNQHRKNMKSTWLGTVYIEVTSTSQLLLKSMKCLLLY
jgi:hypothetical protein